MNDFLNFLYAHIPHRWLNKKAAGTKRLFEGLAKNIAYLNGFVEMLKRNNQTRKAEELITDLENEYGITVNPSYNLDFRRERILAKIRMQDSPVTEQNLIEMLEIMGFYDIFIECLLGKFQVNIHMKTPLDCGYKAAEIHKLFHENLRAHIGVGTVYLLPTFETNTLVGAMVQSSIFIEIFPDITEEWESETVIDAGSKAYLGIYVEVEEE